MSDLEIDMHNEAMDKQITAIDTEADNDRATIMGEMYSEPTEEDLKQWAFDDWCDKNYSDNRWNFRQYAIEMGVSPDSDDGWDEFQKSEYAIYLDNNK